jgi:hypothetical protein
MDNPVSSCTRGRQSSWRPGPRRAGRHGCIALPVPDLAPGCKEIIMAICDTCGNDYDKAFTITRGTLRGLSTALSAPFRLWLQPARTVAAGSSGTGRRVQTGCTAAPTVPASQVTQRPWTDLKKRRAGVPAGDRSVSPNGSGPGRWLPSVLDRVPQRPGPSPGGALCRAAFSTLRPMSSAAARKTIGCRQCSAW